MSPPTLADVGPTIVETTGIANPSIHATGPSRAGSLHNIAAHMDVLYQAPAAYFRQRTSHSLSRAALCCQRTADGPTLPCWHLCLLLLQTPCSIGGPPRDPPTFSEVARIRSVQPYLSNWWDPSPPRSRENVPGLLCPRRSICKARWLKAQGIPGEQLLRPEPSGRDTHYLCPARGPMVRVPAYVICGTSVTGAYATTHRHPPVSGASEPRPSSVGLLSLLPGLGWKTQVGARLRA